MQGRCTVCNGTGFITRNPGKAVSNTPPQPDYKAQSDYWKKRCEAAEAVLECVPIPAKRYYLTGFDEALTKYQQLKQQQP